MFDKFRDDQLRLLILTSQLLKAREKSVVLYNTSHVVKTKYSLGVNFDWFLSMDKYFYSI